MFVKLLICWQQNILIYLLNRLLIFCVPDNEGIPRFNANLKYSLGFKENMKVPQQLFLFHLTVYSRLLSDVDYDPNTHVYLRR